MDRLLPNGATIKAAFGKSRQTFTPEEDIKLIRIVGDAKTINWVNVSKRMKNRTPRQCRERYNTYLAPKLNSADYTPDEDQKIIEMYNKIGNKWSQMARYIKGRTPNSIRNRCLSLLKGNEKTNKDDQKIMDQSSPECFSSILSSETVFSIDSIFSNILPGTIDIFNDNGDSAYSFFGNF